MDLYGHMMEGANRDAARQREAAYRITVERAKETAKMIASPGGNIGFSDQRQEGQKECDQSWSHSGHNLVKLDGIRKGRLKDKHNWVYKL